MKRKILISMMVWGLVFVGMAQAGSFSLIGNYLKVGISDSGALVTDGGGINNATGIQYDPTGAGNFPPAGPGQAPDFVVPANCHEFFSIGVGGLFLTNGYYGAVANYTYHNPMNTTSTNATVGNLLAAETRGNFVLAGATMRVYQYVYFDINSNTINFSVDILNLGNTPVYDVVYARGFDPDQPAYPSNLATFATLNTYPAPGVVQALDTLVTGLPIQIVDGVAGTGKVQIMPASGASWSTDPYAILAEALPNTGLLDNSINIAFNIGTLGPHQSLELDFQYNLAPIPGSLLLLGTGILGLVGIGVRRKSS